MLKDHWVAVVDIYKEGIETGHATFEKKIPEWENWDKSHLIDCRLVAKEGKHIVGWAALSPATDRCVYSGVAELSIYIASAARGKGVGKLLLQELIVESEKTELWTLQAGVFPENIASIKLLKSCGFRKIGYRERIGQMDGVWRDVLLFERRSQVVGP
jgi:phosphinothricin acetyltransferase